MEVWREQHRKMLDQVADYAYDWDELLERIAKLPENQETYAYLEQLVPRLKQMRREMNRVTYKNGYWEIANYSFEPFNYFTKTYPSDVIITPLFLRLPNDALKPKDRDVLQNRRQPE